MVLPLYLDGRGVLGGPVPVLLPELVVCCCSRPLLLLLLLLPLPAALTRKQVLLPSAPNLLMQPGGQLGQSLALPRPLLAPRPPARWRRAARLRLLPSCRPRHRAALPPPAPPPSHGPRPGAPLAPWPA